MTTNEVWTLSIAAYAAIISTFVLGWDAYKWVNSGPKIILSASTGMKIVGNGQIDPKTYISATAINLGDRATTITNLGFLYYKSKPDLWRNKPDQAFVIATPSQAQVLPYRFEPGSQWIGICDQDQAVEAMIREGYLYIVLYYSHGGNGLRHRLTVKELSS